MKNVEELQKLLISCLKPVERLSVSAWSDKYRQLPAASAEPGRWRTSRVPYMREIMDAFTDDKIHTVVAMTGSQLGKSECLNNVIARYMQLDPCTIMMIQPTIDLAEKYSKTRIQPMLEETRSLANLLYKSNQTILTKFYKGGQLIMTGSNSSANLASQPVRILLCDEVDRFADDVGDEGDPISLARVRVSTFWNYKIGLFSTPTIKDESRIELAFQEGTQEYYSYACPNCGEYHALEFGQMKSDAEILQNAKQKIVQVRRVSWQCPDCGLEFSEQEMKQSAQKYIARNPAALENGVRSFWVNTFSSPWQSWRSIMREWYEAKGNPAREKVVTNTRFAESYEPVGEFADEKVFLKRLEEYGAELPAGVEVLTCAVDVQDNRLEYEICGWNKFSECWGVQKSEIYGRPNRQATWEELTQVIEREYSFADGRRLKVARTFIDSGGHFTQEVYKYCREKMRRGVFAIKGQGGAGIPLLYKYAQAADKSVPLILLGVNEGKQEVMTRLSIETVGEQYFHFPKEDELMRGYDEVYFKGLISEHAVVKWKSGKMYKQWEPVKRGVRNEPLDLRVYNCACFLSMKSKTDRSRRKSAGQKLNLM